MTMHDGKGRSYKGKGKATPEGPNAAEVPSATFAPNQAPETRGPTLHLRGSSSGSNGSSGGAGGSQQGNLMAEPRGSAEEPYDYLLDPNPDRKPDGSRYLIDMFPSIAGATPKSEVMPGIPFAVACSQDTAEYRTYQFVRFWRCCAFGCLRLKGKKWHWHFLGQYLKIPAS